MENGYCHIIIHVGHEISPSMYLQWGVMCAFNGVDKADEADETNHVHDDVPVRAE